MIDESGILETDFKTRCLTSSIAVNKELMKRHQQIM